MAGESDDAKAHALAGKLSQLLGETQIHAAPIVAQIHHSEGYRQLEAFLEDLESHTSANITPFLQSVLDRATIPDTIRPLLQEAIETPAQFSAIITQLFLYGIVSQLLSASVQPFIQGVSNDLWTAAVGDGIAVPVSPAVIATAVARGLALGQPPTTTVPQWAYDEAAKSGVSAADMDLQASIVGTPPAPQELFELLRRGIIDLNGVKTGLKEGDTRDDWIDQLSQLSHGWLTPVDFIRAAIQEQMDMGSAETWAAATGLDVTTPLPLNVGSSGIPANMFGLGVAIGGRPPGPQELANMALRGIIPQNGTGADATTFQQGIAESDVKTKWTSALWELAQYLPPPNEIATLLERGGITNAQAITLWQQRGVPPEIAQAYAYITEQQHVTQDKLLAKNIVQTAYYDGLIDHQTALADLDLLGYRGTVADTILAVQDFRREMTALNAVVRRVSTLYGENKLSPVDAKQALIQVGLAPGQADNILEFWTTLRVQPVHLPTAAEIGAAVKYQTITITQALQELAQLGYQDRDAAIVLSAHAEQQITPLPGPGTTVTG